jgi:hypothetical protein
MMKSGNQLIQHLLMGLDSKFASTHQVIARKKHCQSQADDLIPEGHELLLGGPSPVDLHDKEEADRHCFRECVIDSECVHELEEGLPEEHWCVPDHLVMHERQSALDSG